MVAWKIFSRKPQTQQKVTLGRFEIERDEGTAYLEYSMAGNVLTKKLRGLGLASSLAETAFHWARDNNFKVDVVCPSVEEYLTKHPEYKDLVLR